MIKYSSYFSIFLITLLLFVVGCAPSMFTKGRGMMERGEYSKAAELYNEEIRTNPESVKAWREYGFALYKQGELTKAEEALEQANNIKPDAGTNLYLGFIYEKREMFDKALDAYRVSLSLKPKRSVKDQITSRFDYLISKKMKAEVTHAIKQEADINVDSIPENSIGVIDFDNSQLSDDLAPLSKGLAEMTAIDLAKVGSLKVVDRLKIEAILGELKLSKSQYSDPKVGPRLGKLMGSRQIVSGVLTGLGDEKIRMDGSVVNTTAGTSNTTESSQGDLEKFFQIQKEFVFNIIDTLGIELTIDERNAIQEVPTESYLAFLAYSKGLEFRSMGMYQEAAGEFNDAVQMDAGFTAAKQQGQSATRMSASISGGAGSFEQLEGLVVGSGEGTSGTLEGFQSSILSAYGFIGGYDFVNMFTNRFDILLIDKFGTVVIQGDLDAEH
ncbi:MAG: tetratricopeptide repeat protein [candidate division Zixibacteria bacterium]|nr:tetratricopeptide repeat protein [candidate division Zixibacteria bacterium]